MPNIILTSRMSHIVKCETFDAEGVFIHKGMRLISFSFSLRKPSNSSLCWLITFVFQWHILRVVQINFYIIACIEFMNWFVDYYNTPSEVNFVTPSISRINIAPTVVTVRIDIFPVHTTESSILR